MHLPDLHTSEAVMAGVIAGLTGLVGVQLKVILGMVRAVGKTADEHQGRLNELGERLDRAQERRVADAARHRERLEKLIDRYRQAVEVLGGGENGGVA